MDVRRRERRYENVMKFIPAGEIIGSAHQVRTVNIAKSSELPDGDYTFVDTYCTTSTCDCRKAMIQVLHNGKCVSIINFGWEKPSYYEKWMGGSSGDGLTTSMHGSSIDITSPGVIGVIVSY